MTLALTRGPMQSVRIGDDITVTVVWISKDKVRLGFDAPRDVRIVRTEIEDRFPISEEADQ